MSFLRAKPAVVPPVDPTAVAAAAAPPPGTAPGDNLSGSWFQNAMGGDMPAPDAGGSASPGFDANAAADGVARPRRSFLETVGRLSDVFARLGGAAPGYQPAIDAQTARQNAVQDRFTADQDHARQVNLDGLKLQTEQGTLMDAGNKRMGMAVRGLQALKQANPNADLSQAWPLLAQRAGIEPAQAASLGQHLASDPNLIDALVAQTGDGKTNEYGLQPFYAKDKAGNVTTYQLGKDGTVHKVDLPDGVAAIDPTKAVDLGGSVAMVGTRSGNAERILPKSEAPGKAADRASRENIARGNNATTIQVAGMPERAKAGGAEATGPTSPTAAARTSIANMHNALGDLARDPDLSSGTGFIAGAIDTPARQKINAKIKAIEGQAVPVAVSILKAQGVARPAQAEVLATAKGIISDLSLIRQNTGDYRTAIKTAQDRLRQRYSALTPAPAAPAAKSAKPAAGGWKVIGVQ